jgi:hypothetical protein
LNVSEWSDILYQVARFGFATALLFFLYLVMRSTVSESAPESAPEVGAAEPALAYLTVIDPAASGLAPGSTIAVHGRAVLGRGGEAQIRLPDPSVSARHALISFSHGGWWIEDLGSRNGTVIDGETIASETKLQPGNVLQFGAMNLRFVC